MTSNHNRIQAVTEFGFTERQARFLVLVVPVSMALEEAAAVLRQDHRVIAITRHTDGLYQALFAKVPQVA